MKIVLIIIVFLLMNAFLIIANNNFHLNNSDNLDQFISTYLSWFGRISENLTEITGDSIKLDWMP
ncbi:hypothetical protein J4466_04610 [Candidatus Pacearchaeota archaeon]|nr:hypothetical protein [Candidatus Pacearchaeota archaeon]